MSRIEQKLLETEKVKGDLQKESNRIRAEKEEFEQEMSYLQGIYKQELRKNNENQEKIEILSQEIKEKSKELLCVNEDLEQVLHEFEKKYDIIQAEKEDLNRENKQFTEEITRILTDKKRKMFDFKLKIVKN